jgi:hypothetical protein
VHPRALTGPVVEWICSGVPTRLPIPERQTVDLLGEHGVLLFPDDPVDAVESVPQARSRRLIGYITRDPEVIALALHLADAADEGGGPSHGARRTMDPSRILSRHRGQLGRGRCQLPEVATTVLST